MTKISDIADAIPPSPNGHIDNDFAPRIRALVANPLATLGQLAELTGLLARGLHLTNRPQPPGDEFPTGGTPAAVAKAA